MAQTRLKLVAYGIDSADWRIMQPYLDAGELPNLARVLEGAARAELISTVPPITAIAWPAAFTGTNPGKHGLFYFFHLRNQRVTPISNADRQRPALWEILSQAGLRVGCFCVPFTYPADDVKGWMLAGRGGGHTWDRDSVRPAELFDELEPLLRRYPDPNFMLRPEHPRHAVLLRDGWRQRVAWSYDVLSYLLERHPVEALVAVENVADSVQHKLLVTRGLADEPDMVRWAYQQADRLLGLILEHTDEDTAFLLLSDHGAQPIVGYFDHAAWLCQRGYLGYRTAPSSAFMRRALLRLGSRMYHRLISSLKLRSRVRPFERVARVVKFSQLMDWPRTRAFPWPGGGIIVNTPGRSPSPTVAAEDREGLAIEIRDALRATTNPLTGREDIRAFLREELYEGPCIEEAPDVVVAPQDFALAFMNTAPPPRLDKPFWTEQELRDAGLGHVIVCEGAHRREGILALAPGSVELPGTTDIVDVAPTALALLGLPVPDYMDGRSLVGGERVETVATAERRVTEGQVYSEEEEEQIARRLADLGYL